MSSSLRCLRPCLRARNDSIPRAVRCAYIRFHSATQALRWPNEPTRTLETVGKSGSESYPRIKKEEKAISYLKFLENYRNLARGETKVGDEVVVRGRVSTARVAGPKLAFVDLFESGRNADLKSHKVQCLFEYKELSHMNVDVLAFRNFVKGLHRGDVYSVKGVPHRTPRNELTVRATELPQLLSPCLHPLPDKIIDKETRMNNRHVEMLLYPNISDGLRLRSRIIRFLREYLEDEGHIEVQTPILADTAGGAVATPFETSAQHFKDRQIALRIAPELWLKRLILGGFDRVFEIGPSFRNEGIDLIHNPEFTTCEFYTTYASLENLTGTTEDMFLRLSRVIDEFALTDARSLKGLKLKFDPPYRRLDFIPALETAMRCRLPDLGSDNAHVEMISLLKERDIQMPLEPFLPRLLDRLSSIYLEPQCDSPTWIIHHPECLSPLAKSFRHPETGQVVAARAELFINGQEFVNTYEEENSPVEQRRKFEDQLSFCEGDISKGVDESYIQALEWGMPPTGGWGCGIDRLCMLLAGRSRINDVLAFGTLRNVLGLRRQPLQNLDADREKELDALLPTLVSGSEQKV